MMHPQTSATFVHVRAVVGESEMDLLWLRSPLCLWFVCVEEALWRWSQKTGIREEGRDLDEGSVGRKKEKKGEVIPRSQSFVPAPTAVNSWEEKERDRGAGWGAETVHSLVTRPISGWAVTSTPGKPLVIAIKISSSLLIIHQAKVLMKSSVDASQYVYSLLQRDLPHYVCTCIS